MLVELKNGETLNGHLVTCDTWMNLTLKEVVQTSPVLLPYISSTAPSRTSSERYDARSNSNSVS
jgi:small nuclear ribonucleoprotein (snRNP)-like protein